MFRAGLLFALLLSVFPVKADGLSGQHLATALRKGGYVLYIRHTSTDFSKDDSKSSSFEDCANQRPLTDKGREEARTVAGHIRRLGIPVDKVYASPFCRTVETAMLAFGKAEMTQAARGGPVGSDDPKRYDALRKLLAKAPAKGFNNALSSHGNPFYALFGPPYLAEGEIAVVLPGGPSGYSIAGKIKLEDWAALN